MACKSELRSCAEVGNYLHHTYANMSTQSLAVNSYFYDLPIRHVMISLSTSLHVVMTKHKVKLSMASRLSKSF